ncbi:hypothetical protein DSL72_004499 [Monilinia vaccinii-corymbosi]|uniref:3-octaprenyl-4-hydroxybenzoate carboxy-lyase-like N-terminal domain-containing protein n=1 Tax=Monilinia vaccinii-corymbosi TaxID=61207 RepID=A0A8A3P4R5_9HELO|nr:hypothetical protein DSL72_004499 [Monilinia vaccinii-corymbosi]
MSRRNRDIGNTPFCAPQLSDTLGAAMAGYLIARVLRRGLEGDKDLPEINDGINPYLEADAIIRKACETNGPAPPFNNMKSAKCYFESKIRQK